MAKLTLSISDKEKIFWIKSFAKTNQTSVSKLFESYLDSLMAFDQKEFALSDRLANLRQPDKRPQDI